MTAEESEDLSRWLRSTRDWVDRTLAGLVPAEDTPPDVLHRAMRHALFGGGKRLRPAVLRLVSDAFGGDPERAAGPAAAVELVHTYSLVHDDLPCMDDDDLRRGRPTCHVLFGEATAVLAGDALLTLAFEVLAGCEHGARHTRTLAGAAGSRGMVGGQSLDLSLETDACGDVEAILDMHGRKTAALFAAAAEMGAIAAGASADERAQAASFGRALGLSFQAVDDLLDVTGDADTLGKTPGKDAALERATLVAAAGLEGTREKAAELSGAAHAALARLAWPATGLAGQLVDYVLERRR
jgi:geranylgeranyl pyrophosphate synthase